MGGAAVLPDGSEEPFSPGLTGRLFTACHAWGMRLTKAKEDGRATEASTSLRAPGELEGEKDGEARRGEAGKGY